MNMLYLGLMLGWLYLVNLAAGALLAKRVPVFALARAIVVATGLLAMFFVEHLRGFDDLRLAYPLLFVIACIILIKNQTDVWLWVKNDAAFFLGFAWAFFWRWSDPNIHTGTEHITDMFFIANYAQGGTLPPPNLWMAPTVFDCYYAFQHYAAALLARIFDIGPGYAYNLAFPLVFAYAASLVWQTTAYHTRSKTYAWALTFAVLMGASGVIPFIEWLRTPQFNDWPIIASMRFIGSAELRTSIAPFFAGGGREIMSYPLESFGYTLIIGDYHPPVSALLVLIMYASSMLLWLRDGRKSVYVYAMSFSVPLSLLCNAWIFPLIVLTYIGWLLYCWRAKLPIPWVLAMGSLAFGFLLAYPFLSYFALNSLGTPIKLVPWSQKSPFLLILLQNWRVIIMVALLALKKEGRLFAWYVIAAYVVLMLVSETFYVKDGMGGENIRINTGMKWLAWIYLFAFLMAAWLAYDIKNMAVRVVLYAMILIPSLAHAYYLVPHYKAFYINQHKGQLDGTAWLTHDKPVGDMLEYLKNAPPGTVLEHVAADNFTPGAALSSFALKPVYIGWPMHLFTWGKSWGTIRNRKDDMLAFYKGELPDPANWLHRNQIRYVVWSPRETDYEAFKKLRVQLARDYYWKDFNGNPDAPVGIWVRR